MFRHVASLRRTRKTLYRKPPNISPGLIFVRKHFLVGLYRGGEGGLYLGRLYSEVYGIQVSGSIMLNDSHSKQMCVVITLFFSLRLGRDSNAKLDYIILTLSRLGAGENARANYKCFYFNNHYSSGFMTFLKNMMKKHL